MECEICCNIFSDKKEIISCKECKEHANFCIECLFKNDCLCCICNKKINIYELLMIAFSEKLLKLCCSRLSEKFHKVLCEEFIHFFTIKHFFGTWILEYPDISTNLCKHITNVMRSKIKNNIHLCENSLEYILSFKSPDLKINSKKYNINRTGTTCEEMSVLDTNICVYKTMYEDKRGRNLIIKPTIKYDNKELAEDKVGEYFFNFLVALTFPLYNKILNKECCCNNLDCIVCNGIYCTKCLSTEHKPDTCTVVFNDLENVKLCPSCKTLVYKEYGCDDMWCINCKIFFSWRQGIIRYDKPHNPDHIDYSSINMSKKDIIKDIVINEVVDSPDGLSDEFNFISDYIMFHSSQIFHINVDFISKYFILPRLVQQVFVYKLIQMDDIELRSMQNISDLIKLCEVYKDTIIKISDKDHYQIYWDNIFYDSVNIITSNSRIIYTV